MGPKNVSSTSDASWQLQTNTIHVGKQETIPQTTIFIGCKNHSQSWVVYGFYPHDSLLDQLSFGSRREHPISTGQCSIDPMSISWHTKGLYSRAVGYSRIPLVSRVSPTFAASSAMLHPDFAMFDHASLTLSTTFYQWFHRDSIIIPRNISMKSRDISRFTKLREIPIWWHPMIPMFHRLKLQFH